MITATLLAFMHDISDCRIEERPAAIKKKEFTSSYDDFFLNVFYAYE